MQSNSVARTLKKVIRSINPDVSKRCESLLKHHSGSSQLQKNKTQKTGSNRWSRRPVVGGTTSLITLGSFHLLLSHSDRGDLGSAGWVFLFLLLL